MSKQSRRRRIEISMMLLVATILTLAGSIGAAPLAAQEANRASIIVVFGPGDVFSSCVSFAEPEISGIELLRRAGLTVVAQQVAGLGESVCKIEEVGCTYPAEACFCKCLGSPCHYWSYWTWNAGEWVYAGRGASQTMVRQGSINAWVWGDGATRPPAVSENGACGAGLLPQVTNTPAQPTAEAGLSPYPEGTQQLEPTAPPEQGAVPEPSSTPQAYPGTATASTAETGTLPPVTPQVASATAAAQQPQATATPGRQSTPTLASQPSSSPDRSASIIARAATAAGATGTQAPTGPEAADKSGYWAFLGIALLLVLAIGYALLSRRQRARNK